MLRFLVAVVLAAVLFWAGATIKLGSRTFFGHIRAIWKTEEAQEMREGVKEKAGPAVQKMKRGIEKGYEEAMKAEMDNGGVRDAGVDGAIDARK